jgi:hypothetical protein
MRHGIETIMHFVIIKSNSPNTRSTECAGASARSLDIIAHISIGVSDLDRSKRFYDAALAPLGYRCMRAMRTAIGYAYGADTIRVLCDARRASGRAGRKIRIAHLLCGTERSGGRRLSRRSAAPWRTRQRAARSAPDIRSGLLCSLHHRSGRISRRGLLWSGRSVIGSGCAYSR